MARKSTVVAVATVAAFGGGFTHTAGAQTVFSASGADAASIQTTVDDFRAALGDPNNGNALGEQPSGRREINWDAGIVPFDFPGDFFNTTVTRGAEFTTPVASEFRVSNDGVDDEFDTINNTYPDQFTTFSAPRLFTPFDTNVIDGFFFKSGSDQAATVTGFGAVFTDVDLADTTTIEYFDVNGTSLALESVEVADGGLSFLGVNFDSGILASVQITLGTSTIGPDDDPVNGIDIVVLDDFLYSEPIPVPAALALFGLGLAAIGLIRRR